MTAVSELSLAGLTVSRETIGALQHLQALVQRWNPAVNLVSKSSVGELWERHIVDSAQLFLACPQSATVWADLGAGGGFPGLVIATLARELQSSLRVTLVEADQRKSTFLRQAAQSLDLEVSVLSARIESLPPFQADVLSARALAALPGLLEYAAAHLNPDGVAIFPKGARHRDELAQARRAWAFDVEIRPSLSDADAALLVIRNIHRAKD
jgi:16S rRNA (guanine527-N7)-methyltransferase